MLLIFFTISSRQGGAFLLFINFEVGYQLRQMSTQVWIFSMKFSRAIIFTDYTGIIFFILLHFESIRCGRVFLIGNEDQDWVYIHSSGDCPMYLQIFSNPSGYSSPPPRLLVLFRILPIYSGVESIALTGSLLKSIYLPIYLY